MALNNIYGTSYFFYDILNDGNDRYFASIWNDVTETIQVWEYPSIPTDPNVSGIQLSGGVDLPVEFFPPSFDIDLPYQFCEGSTLNTFNPSQEFPYAIRRETANSPACTFTLCDLEIVQPIAVTKESSAGASDATATITTNTSNGPVEFSIDAGSTWQSSNVFSGLGAGQYEVRARDSGGCTAVATFQISTALEYGEKFRRQFLDTRGQRYLLKIFQDGWEGPYTEFELGNPPVIMSMQKGQDKFQPIKNTSIRIQPIAVTNYEFLEFFEGEDFTYKVTIQSAGVDTVTGIDVEFDAGSSRVIFTDIRAQIQIGDILRFEGSGSNDAIAYTVIAEPVADFEFEVSPAIAVSEVAPDIVYYQETLNNLFFQGFILPAIYSESYIAPPYQVELQATDGFSQLRDIDFLNLDGSPITGVKSFREIVQICLSNIPDSDALVIQEAINIYEENMDSATNDSVLKQVYKNCDGYAGLSCYEVLEDIAKIFGAQWRQWDGAWMITNIQNADQTYSVQQYKLDGTSHTSFNRNPALAITDKDEPKATRVLWIQGDQNLEIREAYQKVEVEYDLVLDDTLLQDGSFPFSAWDSFSELKRWITNGTISRRGIADEEEKLAVAILGVTNAQANAFYLQSQPVTLDTTPSSGSSRITVNFSYKVVCNDSPDNANFVDVYYSVKFGSFFAKSDIGFSNTAQYLKVETDSFNQFNTYEKTFFYVPTQSGDVTITFYQAVSVGSVYNVEELQITDVRLQFFPDADKAQKTTSYTLKNEGFKTKFLPEKINVLSGDGQSTPGAKSIYKSPLQLSDGTVCRRWARRGVTESRALIELLAEQVLAAHARTWQLLTGSLESSVVQSYSCISDPDNTGRKFLITGWDWNIWKNRFQVELSEYVDGSAFGENLNFKLLADGTPKLLSFQGAKLLADN